MKTTPTSGYYAEIDIIGGADDVRTLRHELRALNIHTAVLALCGPAGGNPLVRLRSMSRTALEQWLVSSGYDLDVNPVIDARNADAIPHRKAVQ